MIKNAKNIPLNQTAAGNVPNMSGTITGWMQPMIFNFIGKIVQDYVVVETAPDLKFMGVWQPLTMEQLRMMPYAQRSWSWFMVHAHTDLFLKVDDVIKYRGVQYRVKARSNYNEYGYFEYHLIEDSTGTGTPAIEEEDDIAP